MNRLDELLADSRPRVMPSAVLDAVTTRVTAPRRRRGLVIAGIVTLSLAGGTAAFAGDTPLDDLIDYYLSGDQTEHNDHAWQMDITGVDGTLNCVGGIVIMPNAERPEFTQASYLAIKQFVQENDWSNLQPNPELLHEWQPGTAEQLAITADRNMIEIALDEGFTTDSISTRLTATCTPK